MMPSKKQLHTDRNLHPFAPPSSMQPSSLLNINTGTLERPTGKTLYSRQTSSLDDLSKQQCLIDLQRERRYTCTLSDITTLNRLVHSSLSTSLDHSLALSTVSIKRQGRSHSTERQTHTGCGIRGRSPSVRIVLALLGFLIFLNTYSHRVSMSIAIVRMVNHSAVQVLYKSGEDTTNLTSQINPYENETEYDLHPQSQHGEVLVECDRAVTWNHNTQYNGPFMWDKAIQGHILGSFYYGYALSQITGALAAQRFGGCIVVSLCIVLTSFCSACLPLVAAWGYGYVMACRIGTGFGAGAMYPAMMSVIAQWSAPMERTKMYNVVIAGGALGLIVSYPVAGLLSQLSDNGWALIFYVFGAATLLTVIPWAIMITDSPHENRFISPSERDYIQLKLEWQLRQGKKCIPWCSVLRCMPVWAIAVGMITTDFGYTMYLSYIPTYMDEVLHLDIQQNSLLSCLPFLGHWIMLLVFPIILDYLLTRKIITLNMARKSAHTIGAVGAAVFLVVLTTVDCYQPYIAVGLLVSGVTLCACVYSGFPVNILDLSPQHAGPILGITNTIAAVSGFISPMVVTAFTSQNSTLGWHYVFYVTAAIYIAGTLFYCVFGSVQYQTWSSSESTDKPAVTSEKCINQDEADCPVLIKS